MDAINEYLKRTRKVTILITGEEYEDIRPRVECKDGFVISVQANKYAYCTPRINGASEYEEVELGFPNREDKLIEDYAEDPYSLTQTVYGYVPVELVNQLVEKHGGIVN